MTPATAATARQTQPALNDTWLVQACLRLIAVAAITLAAGNVAAQLRTIPDDSKRGVIRHVQELMVSIDGKNVLMAPGGNIRDRNNFIIVPTALPPGGALVDYMLDMNGQVFRAWILSEEEARRPKKSPAPR